MPRNNATMTSVEAAALYLSEGKTTDPELAQQLSTGQLLDPERLTQAHFRRMLGFDFTVTRDDAHLKFLVKDQELGITTTCAIVDDLAQQAARVTKACMKLKKLHDKAVADQVND